MAGFLNRLKNLKPGSNSNNESDTNSICSFDEEGFLCPVCHRKFPDTTSLEHHYSQTHIQSSSSNSTYETNNGRYESSDESMQEIAMWKEQFLSSEQSRMTLTSDLMHQKQRVGDLEEELDLLRKQLRSAQAKILEQSTEITSLKSAKDAYDAQLAVFTDELLSTKDELKQKESQVMTLCNDLIPRPTDDDVSVLKKELIGVQQRMNDMALDRENEIERFKQTLRDLFELTKQFDGFETTFEQNLQMFHQIVDEQMTENIDQSHSIKPWINAVRERKEKIETLWKSNQSELDQLKENNFQLQRQLDDQIQLKEQLNNELVTEQKAKEAAQSTIEALEKSLEELREEKNQLILTKMNDGQDEERQNFFRLLHQEKDQLEQQVKELRKQLKNLNEEKEQLESTCQSLRSELTERDEEHRRVREELERERNDAHQTLNNQKEEHERTENELKELHRRVIDEHEENQREMERQREIERETQENRIRELNEELKKIREEKEETLQRYSNGLRRCLELLRKNQRFIEETISSSQWKVLQTIEQSMEESTNVRQQTFDQIREEFTQYLTVLNEVISDRKNQLDKEKEDHRLELIEKDQEIQKIREAFEQKQREFDEVSEKLSEMLKTMNLEREKFEEEIKLRDDQMESMRVDLDSRTKKSEMQITALKENLGTVRSDLRAAQEKLVELEQLKVEKSDLEKRLATCEEERQLLSERSMTNESKIAKLVRENAELAKKNSDAESALQEIAREYQSLQIQTNTLSQRRWVNDQDIHQCMKCDVHFSLTQRKHHCRSCGNVFCERCSSKSAIIAATSKKPQRVCDQCYKELTS